MSILGGPDAADEARARARLGSVQRRAGDLRWRRAVLAVAVVVVVAAVGVVVPAAFGNGPHVAKLAVVASEPTSAATTTSTTSDVPVSVATPTTKAPAVVPVVTTSTRPGAVTTAAAPVSVTATTTASTRTTATIATTVTTKAPSSTTTTQPETPLPVGSVSGQGPHEWWILGTRATCAGASLCITHTTDGGAVYTETAGPPGVVFGGSSATAVSHLTFVNELDGFAWGPALWATTNGGVTWDAIDVPVVQRLVGDGSGDELAYALVDGCVSLPTPSCQYVDSLSLPSGGGAITASQLATPQPGQSVAAPSSIAVFGESVWVGFGALDPLMASTDAGVTFAAGAQPACATSGATDQADDPLGSMVATSSLDVLLLCPRAPGYELLSSLDGGNTFARDPYATPQAVGADVALSAGPTGAVCTLSSGAALLCAPNPGKKLRPVPAVGTPVDDVALVASTGFAVVGAPAVGRLFIWPSNGAWTAVTSPLSR